jgi:hypothetical protein
MDDHILVQGQLERVHVCCCCPSQVPPGHIWVEGDNLIVSRDSREYGPIPLGLLRGRVMLQVGQPCMQATTASLHCFTQLPGALAVGVGNSRSQIG